MLTLRDSIKHFLKPIVESINGSGLSTEVINEGGMAGHMAHPIDFSYFTAKDLKQLISDLFSGKVEDITEKIDGTNIQATVNANGQVVFIRNNGDLNSENGGMSIEDMAAKWADKPSVANTFITAGKTITKVFSTIDSKFFNPSPDKKLAVNCECVIAGVTNIMPYADSQVDFHNIHIYKKLNEGWVLDDVTKKGLDIIDKACADVDEAKLTPKVIIEITDKSNDLIKKYSNMIDDLFGKDDNLSIDSWKHARFDELVKEKAPWIMSNEDGAKILFNRWFNGDKSTNLKVVKQMYPDNLTELTDMDKTGYKEMVSDVIEPLDDIFMKLGNDVIRMCSGLINGSNNDKVVVKLQDEMRKVVKDVKANGSRSAQTKLVKQLKRIERLGGDESINSAEGIVFRYNGKLMKLTGSFSPLNQILGSIKFSK